MRVSGNSYSSSVLDCCVGLHLQLVSNCKYIVVPLYKGVASHYYSMLFLFLKCEIMEWYCSEMNQWICSLNSHFLWSGRKHGRESIWKSYGSNECNDMRTKQCGRQNYPSYLYPTISTTLSIDTTRHGSPRKRPCGAYNIVVGT